VMRGTQSHPSATSFSIAVLALALALLTGCGNEHRHGTALQAPPRSAVFMIVAANECGAVVLRQPLPGAGPEIETVVAGWDSRGRQLWHLTAFDQLLDVASTVPPTAAVVVPSNTSITTSKLLRLLLLDGGHTHPRTGAESRDYLQVIYSTSSRLVYVCRSGGAIEVVCRDGDSSSRLRLSDRLRPTFVSSSADGSRIAVSQQGASLSTISWLRIDNTGKLATVRVSHDCHPYASLSPRGNQAVLGGRRPVLVSFGHVRGRALPAQYASVVNFGKGSTGRVLLEENYAVNGQPRAVVVVCRLDGRLLLRVALRGDVGVVHADPTLQWVAYTDRCTGTAFLLDVRADKTVHISGVVDDVWPVSARTLAMVARNGLVSFISSPKL
jgi:hypothetical protein